MIAGIKYWSEREKVDPVWLVVPLESQMHGPEMQLTHLKGATRLKVMPTDYLTFINVFGIRKTESMLFQFFVSSVNSSGSRRRDCSCIGIGHITIKT